MPGSHRLMPEYVFLDRSGRRRRLVRLLAAGAAVILLGVLGLLVAGLTGGGFLPLPGVAATAGPPAHGTTPNPEPPGPTGSAAGASPRTDPAPTATSTPAVEPARSPRGRGPTAPPAHGRPTKAP